MATRQPAPATVQVGAKLAGLTLRADAIGGTDAEMVIAYTSGRRAYEEAG